MKKIYLIYPDKKGTIAPEIYGHFSEHIGGVIYGGLWVGKESEIPNIRGWRKELVEKLKNINPPVLRWPGGCFAETYDWRDGIGKNRPVRHNWWGYMDGKYETNEVGTHEFVDLCELVGAKPYFAVNITSITPMQARNWMDYCLSPRGSTTLALEREANGHPEPFDIPFWGIGNENWGDGGDMTPDYYALEYRRFSAVLNNLKRESDRLFVGGANAADYNWTHDVCKNLSDVSHTKFNGLTYHFYTCPGVHCLDFDENGWNKVISTAQQMEYLIDRHYAIAKGFGLEKDMKLVVDEWGCWFSGGSGPSKGQNLFEQQSTMRDAMVAAFTLNIFNNNCDKIQMANVAQICNNLHALFLAGGEHCITTPTYHIFDMYKEHQGAECIGVSITDNDELLNSITVSASIKDSKTLVTIGNLSCINDVEFTLEGIGAYIGKLAEGILLYSEDMNAHNTFEAPYTITPKQIQIDLTKPILLPKTGVLSIRF